MGSRELRRAEEDDTALPEEVVERPDADRRADRSVREDDVEVVHGELGEKPFGLVLATDQPAGSDSLSAGSRRRRATSLGTTSATPTTKFRGLPTGLPLTASRSSRPSVKISSA